MHEFNLFVLILTIIQFECMNRICFGELSNSAFVCNDTYDFLFIPLNIFFWAGVIELNNQDET